MEELNLRCYAHIGDAVYEVFVRELVIYKTSNGKKLHELSTKYVNAEFQANMLEKLSEKLTEKELDLTRRGRNLSTTIAKRQNQSTHRQATAFEVLLGYNYLHDKTRYNQLLEIITPSIDCL